MYEYVLSTYLPKIVVGCVMNVISCKLQDNLRMKHCYINLMRTFPKLRESK